ncbi:MAG: SH3 domain-containing protein [Clostridia bacterium]|nr:SH3 domain-containing protein [Clostridia bacterium]
MNRRNNSVLVVMVSVLATLVVVMSIAIILIYTGVISRRSSKQIQNESTVVSTSVKSDATIYDEETELSDDIPTMMYVANVKMSIYFRGEPTEDADNIITTIPVGTPVLWLENTNTVFSEISYNGIIGYVKRDYLSLENPYHDESSGDNTAIYKYMYVANVKNSIYLRSTASEDADNIITTIPVGTRIGYIENTNNVFSKIYYNGVCGYAKTAYLADYYDSGYTYLTVCNVKNSIYLRSEPKENKNNIICEIPVGSTVRYLSSATGGFYKISYNGYVGYSKSAYLR